MLCGRTHTSAILSLCKLNLKLQLRSTAALVPATVQQSRSLQTSPGDSLQRQTASQSKILTLPNVITMSRIALTPLIGHYIFTSQMGPALGVFAYCCVTDFLDGYIARRYKTNSIAGTILDPIADKLLMVVTTVAMTFPPGPQIIPMSIAGLILGRDVLLGLSGVVVRYRSIKAVYKNAPWNMYWNFMKFPSVEVKPTVISKWNTFLQMIYLGVAGVLLIIRGSDSELQDQEDTDVKVGGKYPWLEQDFTWLGYVVGATTVLSGGSYIFSRSAIRYLPRIK
ncbi:cardiolipin synthase KNAG_0B02760 [Huiozyma naganishii CBS 8797]|uniref:CDP-diacylglycerol--glycerol-3-phosphate 3-phosphatidyltransferase n=1 Tax=Huiozyma naganishii (strain ATCC MYA-139 / BCRC 22969 / CBS 8797 / KCTC 17520 / NBRC 10181 / NCYC 3082 / Yp74L-3) TaxID=1071383 RepID=J7S3G7_HUIN7|nr:hypothetical protein KNAG_0B02760 [Kazachstania naganishii CBS 8797]CCK68719.1 hypothetical protein KNAG_0B02760 [Kazachstania naganishii CBS 8797]